MYDKIYAKNEFLFFDFIKNVEEENFKVIKTKDITLELEIKGSVFRKTAQAGIPVSIDIELFELPTEATGGVQSNLSIFTNRDLTKSSNTSHLIEMLEKGDEEGEELVFNEEGKLLLFRCCATVDKISSDNIIQPKDFYRFKMNKNKTYLIKSSVLTGVVNTSMSGYYGLLREVTQNI